MASSLFIDTGACGVLDVWMESTQLGCVVSREKSTQPGGFQMGIITPPELAQCSLGPWRVQYVNWILSSSSGDRLL